jgi:hypothetical protein
MLRLFRNNALAGRTPQTHGEHYKYTKNYMVRQHKPAQL